MNTTTLKIEHRGAAAWVWMNRPELHDACDETLISEQTDAFATLDRDPKVRAIVLAGEGKSFSAGGDLNRMKRQGAAPLDANRSDAQKLATLFRTISMCATPTLARVQGAALGGGMGLASACDICIASTKAQVATSELCLGIIPAALGPYVVRAVGERPAYRHFQTAERITGGRAARAGCRHGPDPRRGTPRGGDEVVEDTACRIATLRATPEAKEGLSAFLETRPAGLVPAKA